MLSHIVEDRRYRSVRAWPIWRKESEEYLLTELGHEVQIDGVNFDTAPIKNGVSFSLVGISQTNESLAMGMHHNTDHLSYKAYLEYVFLKFKDQTVRHLLNIPYLVDPNNTYRRLHIAEAVEFEISSATRDIDGRPLAITDPFTAAGIKIQITFDIRGTINLELADTHVGAAIRPQLTVTYPSYKSLSSHETRLEIQRDISALLPYMDVKGFTIDIDRKNWLDMDLQLRHSKKFLDPEPAAAALAARYGQSS